MVRSTTVKLCESVDLVQWYIPCFRYVRKGNVGHVTAGKVKRDASMQLYSGSVLIAPIGGTFARRSYDAQY